MRILVVLHTLRSPHSAVFIGYTQLRDHLARRGSTLDILTPNDLPALGRLHGRWLPLAYPPLVARWLARRRSDYDVVVFHSYAGWAAGLLRRRPFRSVTVFHGLEPLYYRELAVEMRRQGRSLRLPFRVLHGALVPRLIRASCRRSDAAFCLNRAEEQFLHQHGWNRDVRCLSHGVGDEWFQPRVPAPDVHEILFVGQWQPTKGIRYLVEAFSVFAAAHPDARLRCVGTLAPEEDVLAAFPEATRPRVVVRPRVDQADLPAIYRGADVFVFPSLSEGFGRVLLEAMASALPIVVTPVGVAADLLEDGRDCLMVPPRDSQALAGALARLAGDAGLRERLGEAARQRALGRTLEAMLDRTTAALASLGPAALS